MRQRAKLGKWHGGWTPFGYDYDIEKKKLFIAFSQQPIYHTAIVTRSTELSFHTDIKPSE